MAEKTSKLKKFIIIGALAVVVIVILGMVFGGKDDSIEVQIEKSKKRSLTQVVSATGKIRPVTQVVITPEVTGEIVSLPVKEGDKVKKGQLLIKIKPDLYIAQQERMKASLDSTRANLRTKKVETDFLKAEYERVSQLFKSGMSNQQQLEKAQSDLSSSQSQIESLNAAISQAQASLKEVNESLNKTTIFAPMDGTISQLNVKLGERVLGSGFSQGTNIMTVADLNEMEALVEAAENDVVLLSKDDKARIKIDAFKDKIFNGTVTHIGNSAKTTGEGTQDVVVNFEIRIALDKGLEEVRPGMSCSADIETETRSNVVSVPIMSVTARSEEFEEKKGPGEEADGNMVLAAEKVKKQKRPQEIVFVVKDNKAVIKKVKTGISDDTYIEIREGLDEGETVVSGTYKAISKDLKDGAKIKLKKEEKPGKKG